MTSRLALDEDRILRFGAGAVGATLLAAAAIAAELAAEHMAILGAICGAGQSPHCGWCYGAVSLALAGFTAIRWATAPWARRPRACPTR